MANGRTTVHLYSLRSVVFASCGVEECGERSGEGRPSISNL
jgi:hypothetical protein